MNQVAAITITTATPETAGAGARASDEAATGNDFVSVLASLLSPNTTPQIEKAGELLPTEPAATTSATDAPTANIDAAIAAQLTVMQLALQSAQAQTATPREITASKPAPTANIDARLHLRGTLSPTPESAQPNTKDTKGEKTAASAVAIDAAAFAGLAAAPHKLSAAPVAAPSKPAVAAKRANQTAPADGATTTAPNAPAPNSKGADTPAANPIPPIDAQSSTGNGAQSSPNKTDGNTAQQIVQAHASVLPNLIGTHQFNTTLATAQQPAIPLDALAVHIARKFESGASRFEISLHPADLGKLDISLSVAEDGQVQASIRAERPETLDLLQRDSRNLEQQLRQAGLDVGSNALNFSLSNGSNGRPAPFTGWPAFASNAEDATPSKEDLAAKYVAVRIRDGVDIQV